MNCQAHSTATDPTSVRGAGSSSNAASALGALRSAQLGQATGCAAGCSHAATASIRWRPRSRHFAPQGQERHLPVHGRRAEPPGAVRQQAGAGEVRRHTAAGGAAQGLSRGVHQSQLQAAGAEVQVRQARPVRGGALGAAAAPGEGRRRHRDRRSRWSPTPSIMRPARS